jgi:hypothetical protein
MVEARALELLGVGQLEGVSRDELRRAYLRAVKAHPPERDADGFREVREAYELLQGALQLQEFRASVLQAEARAVASEVSSNLNLGPEEKAMIAEPAQQREEAVVAKPAQAQEEAVVAEPAQPQEEKPPDPLASELMELQSAFEAEDAARAGVSLSKLYESPAVPSEMLPPAGFAFRLALRLFESDKPALARRVLSGFEEHSRRFGSASQLDTTTAARWVLLKEVVQLSRVAEDPRVVAALASGLLADNLIEAARVIDRSCAQKPALAERLARYAPSICATLRPYLQWTQRQQVQQSKSYSPRWIGWVLFVALSNGVRICASNTSSSTTSAHISAPALQRRPPENHRYELTTNLAFELTQAIDAFDCSRIRLTWPGYVASLRSAATAKQRADAHEVRERVRNACPDLDDSLEELP